MINAIFSLGANLGDRKRQMNEMTELLNQILRPLICTSKLMETEPIGTPDKQQWYYNRIVSGRFNGSAQSLLERCQQIENKLGRERKNRLEARIADIDILLVDDYIITENNLIIPHHQLLNRRFCIEGIKAIAPDRIHPIEKKTFKDLYKHMDKNVLKQKIRYIGI